MRFKVFQSKKKQFADLVALHFLRKFIFNQRFGFIMCYDRNSFDIV